MKAKVTDKLFRPAADALAERYSLITILSLPGEIPGGFSEQLEEVVGAVRQIASRERVMFCRFFLSDSANQTEALGRAVGNIGLPAVSVVQQPPLDGTKIAVWVYSVRGEFNSTYSHFWTAGLTARERKGSHAQMLDIFKDYQNTLETLQPGLCVANNCIRTWIFTQNVDVNYGGVVTGRKEYFDNIGLTSGTHYIASTGIEGRHADHTALVQMDAYAVGGLQEAQILYLQAPSHLNPTYEYGVTFERGTAVIYGDRRHIFISGTASIDNHGDVMHVGDIARQTGRMLENVGALLSKAGAGLSDVAQVTVYLRDIADAAVVRTIFAREHPELNAVFVQAPVCRPQWLIEMECIALTTNGDSRFDTL